MAEAGDLKLFLQKILDGGTEQLRINVDAQTSKQELEKLKFNDWVSLANRNYATWCYGKRRGFLVGLPIGQKCY